MMEHGVISRTEQPPSGGFLLLATHAADHERAGRYIEAAKAWAAAGGAALREANRLYAQHRSDLCDRLVTLNRPVYG